MQSILKLLELFYNLLENVHLRTNFIFKLNLKNKVIYVPCDHKMRINAAIFGKQVYKFLIYR
jgi:hypothetical protein